MNEIGEGIITVFILSLITVGFFSAVVAHDNAELSTTIVIPEPYYTGTRNPDLTSADLLDLLLNHYTVPHEYERDVFDCTEGAAYMEWYLENRGYDADIVHGVRTACGFHAIVIVHLKDRDEGVIDTFRPSFYYGPPPKDGRVLKDIYDVWTWEGKQHEDIPGWKREYSEYDWWTEVNFTAVNS